MIPAAGAEATRAEVARVIRDYLDEQGIPFESPSAGELALALHGENKRSLPVAVTIRERSAAFVSFFMRRPMDNPGETYRMLLGRNLRGGPVRFAADADGDVYLIGELPLAGFDAVAVDGMLGALLSVADEVFPAAVAVGFASYVERERSWRAAAEAAAEKAGGA